MPDPGRVYALVMVGGTSSTDPDSIAQRWKADPYNTFAPEFIKARAWADLNGQDTRLCLYQPCGYPRTGVMPLDAYTQMLAKDTFYCAEIRRIIRDFAPQCADFLIYTGSPESKADWRYNEVRANIAPYAMQGATSIAFDQSADLQSTPWFELFRRADLAFANVALEGQCRANNPWTRGWFRNLVTASWNPSDPSKYLPLVPGDFVLIGNVPESMAGATREDKTKWKLDQCRKWLPLGMHCIIDVDEVQGVEYAALAGVLSE